MFWDIYLNYDNCSPAQVGGCVINVRGDPQPSAPVSFGPRCINGGCVGEEADGIDELIAADDADAELNPSAFIDDVAQPEVEEKDADDDAFVAPCSLTARVHRTCARCPNSWLVKQIINSIFQR